MLTCVAIGGIAFSQLPMQCLLLKQNELHDLDTTVQIPNKTLTLHFTQYSKL